MPFILAAGNFHSAMLCWEMHNDNESKLYVVTSIASSCCKGIRHCIGRPVNIPTGLWTSVNRVRTSYNGLHTTLNQITPIPVVSGTSKSCPWTIAFVHLLGTSLDHVTTSLRATKWKTNLGDSIWLLRFLGILVWLH